MDAYDIITHMSNHLALRERLYWFGVGWVIYSDTRSGTPVERWTQDFEMYQLLRGAA